MGNQIIRAKYVSKNGTNFSTGINSEVAAQTGTTDPAVSLIGYAAAGAGLLPLPRQMKPRRVVLYNPAGKRRELICLTETAPLYAGGQTSIPLEDSDGAETVYTVDQTRPESFRARRKAAAV